MRGWSRYRRIESGGTGVCHYEGRVASRRPLYRNVKWLLIAQGAKCWRGPARELERRVREFLRGKGRAYLLRLILRPSLAAAVAVLLFAGSAARAEAPVELSSVAAGTGGFVMNGINVDDFSGYSVSGAGDVNGDGLADLIVGAWGVGQFATGESYVVFSPVVVAAPLKVWADFAYVGTETGSVTQPFNTLNEGLLSVADGGTVNVKGNTADNDSPETLIISQGVTIVAINGAITIGQSGARRVVASPAKIGFVAGAAGVR